MRPLIGWAGELLAMSAARFSHAPLGLWYVSGNLGWTQFRGTVSQLKHQGAQGLSASDSFGTTLIIERYQGALVLLPGYSSEVSIIQTYHHACLCNQRPRMI